jgi:hypothetical protein
MNQLSALILNTHFPAFCQKTRRKHTFRSAVRQIVKKDVEFGGDPVPFVPDGWMVNRRRRESCIVEIEDTNPISERKRDAICRLMWWLDDNLWHLHLIRENAPTRAFFLMNGDDVAAWDFSKHPAREWHFEESLAGVKGYFSLCAGKGQLKKREAFPSLLGNLGALDETTTTRLFYSPDGVSSQRPFN